MTSHSIAAAANTVVPAILALEACGYSVSKEGAHMGAVAGADRYVADDPVTLPGLIKLIEVRGRSWKPRDKETDEVLRRFGWTNER